LLNLCHRGMKKQSLLSFRQYHWMKVYRPERILYGEKMLSAEGKSRHNSQTKLHDVYENARKLAVLYTIEVEVARLIGRWIPTIPHIGGKLLLGRLIFEDAEHAGWLEARLVELRVPEARLAAFAHKSLTYAPPMNWVDRYIYRRRSDVCATDATRPPDRYRGGSLL
jgi:hypothetical protein